MINLQSWLPCVLLSLFEIKLFPPFFNLETIAHLTHNGHPCVSTNCFQCVPLQILQHSHHTCLSIIISGDKARPLFAERTERLTCVAARASLDLFLFVAWSAVLASSNSYVLLVFWGVQISQLLESMLRCGTFHKRSNDSNFFPWTTWKICSRSVDSSFSRGSVRKCSSDSIRWNMNICRCFFFVFCLLSRSLFRFIKPPGRFGCFTFTLLFYNNARPLLSSFLFSVFKYFILVLHVKPCIIFSFLLFLPLAWFTQSLSSSFSHVSIDV